MITVDPVLETHDAAGFTAWPIGAPPEDHFLALSGRMSPADVRTAMAVVFEYNGIPVTHLTDARLHRHLAETEGLLAPGGLRFRDTAAGVTIAPGCCSGLEDWREWWGVVHGRELWLGHDPALHVTQAEHTVRLQQDDEDSPYIEITRDELSGLLTTAQQHLSGFLGLARRWAAATTPDAATRLISALDQHLEITADQRV